jgi:hypothetical protein
MLRLVCGSTVGSVNGWKLMQRAAMYSVKESSAVGAITGSAPVVAAVGSAMSELALTGVGAAGVTTGKAAV